MCMFYDNQVVPLLHVGKGIWLYKITNLPSDNAGSWRLHFFWRRVYISEPDMMYHLHNTPGKNLAKTPFGKINLAWIRVSDPGSTGKKDRLNLRFFWGRVY